MKTSAFHSFLGPFSSQDLRHFASGMSGALACWGRCFAVTWSRRIGNRAPPRAVNQRLFPSLGAGWFQAAEVVKTGGFNDNTTVTLELTGDRRSAPRLRISRNPGCSSVPHS